MYSDKRANQSGSVAVFLIVSVVLAAAVIGGVYFVHQRGAQVRTAQPVAQQSSTNDRQPDPQPQPTGDAKQQEEARKQAEAAKQAEEAKKKADQEAKQRQDQLAKEQAQKQAAQQAPAQTPVPQTGPSTPASQTPEPSGHLPTTGPEDTLLQLLAGGSMIAILGAYLRSYRHRFGSLLR